MIRQTRKTDLPELSKIYTVAYNSLNIGENWTDDASYKLMEHFFKEQEDLFFTAEEDNKIIGGIVASVRPWWDGNHLIDGELFIDPNFQRKGIGKRLIKKLFQTAKEKYNVISWDTYTHRVYEYPLKWYKNLGFEEIKHWVMITGDISKVLEKLKDI